MEPTVIKSTDLRIRTRELMERVKYGGESFLVQTFGHPTAMIVNVDHYKKILLENRARTALPERSRQPHRKRKLLSASRKRR